MGQKEQVLIYRLNEVRRDVRHVRAELRFLLERDDWAEPDEYAYSVKSHLADLLRVLDNAV